MFVHLQGLYRPCEKYDKGDFIMNAKKMLSLGLSALMTLGSMGYAAPFSSDLLQAAAVDDCNDDWLHAKGSRLYDKHGNEVWLTGANWFGFNCSENVPHYLWSGDIDDFLSSIADHGINVIRFPISTELLLSWMNGTPNPVGSVQAGYDPPQDTVAEDGTVTPAGYYVNINKDFVLEDGKTLKNSMEIFDIIMAKCKQYGLKAFVDIHSPHADNSGHVYNLWYGKETSDGTMVTTDMWIDSLVWLAEKYSNDDTLLGYDLKNEPHGKGQEGDKAAKWDDSTDENNWAYAATRCANAILEVNPNALIFVEGVEQQLKEGSGNYWGMPDSLTNSPYYPGWWGGQLRGVRDNPVVPDSGTSQIVYSPHDYGPSVYAQTWFDKDFTTQTLLDDYWYDTWAFINAEDIAPLLIGEWGGHMDGGKNQKWMELLRDYMIDNHISHTFWCLNTNSGDTGGLWSGLGFTQGSGTSIEWDEEKYGMMELSLWQTQESGLYIGLDHQKALGNNGTGLSLNEFYASYASTEGSNLDGGTIVSGTPIVTDTPSDSTSSTTTTSDTATEKLWGDIDCSGIVNVADGVLYNRYIAEDADVVVTDAGLAQADVNGDARVTATDTSLVLRFVANLIPASDLNPNA